MTEVQTKLNEKIPFFVIETSALPSGCGGKDFIFIFIFYQLCKNVLEDSSFNRKKGGTEEFRNLV